MKIISFLAGTVTTALILTGCSSESPVDANANVAKGEASYASFRITLANAGARANGDDNADEVEQTIDNLTLYIFSGGVLEKSYPVNQSEIVNNVVGPVEITTGDKVVYAVVGTEVAAVEEQTRISEFKSTVIDALASDIAVADNFVMTSEATPATIIKSTQANPARVDITVVRAAAKAQVRYVADDVQVRPTIAATFDNAKFALVQNAKSMYLTFDPRSYTPGTKKNSTGTYDGFTSVTAADLIDAVEEFSANYDESAYTGECYNLKPVTGNTTFALVNLTATPAKVYSAAKKTNDAVTLTEGKLPSDGTFYVVAKNDAKTASYVFAANASYDILYFTTETAAKGYITAASLSSSEWKAYKYDKGQVYYRVNLVSDKNAAADGPDKYCVLRNHYYKINVTDVKALGAPTTAGVVPTDPDQPLEADAWLDAEINIEDWQVVDMDDTVLQ